MTAKKSKPVTPAVLRYIAQNSGMMLGKDDPGYELKERQNLVASYFEGRLFATYEIGDEELVYRFRCPKNLATMEDKLHHYVDLAVPDGWVEFRRPLSRDPTPDLAADLGRMLGRLAREMEQPAPGETAHPSESLGLDEIRFEYAAGHEAPPKDDSLPNTTSFGGPYVVLPESKLDAYAGSDDDALYEGVCDAATEAGVIAEVVGSPALVLGTPDNLYWQAEASGGLLVRVSSMDVAEGEEVEAVLRAHLSKLPEKGWKKLKGELKVEEAWFAFDSALPGEEATVAGLELALAPGGYEAQSLTHVLENQSGEFLLVRLSKKE